MNKLFKKINPISKFSTYTLSNRLNRPFINTVVFDIYETIVFPKKGLRPAPVQAFIDTFHYYGYDISSLKNNINDGFISIINKHMGKSKKVHLESILLEPYMREFNIELVHKHNISIDEMYKTFNKIQNEILSNPDFVQLHPKYFEIEEKIRNLGVVNICFTTGFNGLQTSIVFNNIQPIRFNKIITTDTVINPRPNPEGMYKIMEKCDVYDFNVLKIGDTLADIAEGNNAGTISVGVTSGSVSREQFEEAGADYVINDLSYLSGLIMHINKVNNINHKS